LAQTIARNKKGSVSKGRRPSASLSSTADRNPIDRMGTEKVFSHHEKIFRKGQSAKHIYKVEVGCIRTYVHHKDGRRFITAFYFTGDYFGLEMRETHAVSAETITPSTVRVISSKAITSRAASEIAVSKYMLAITNAELQRAQYHNLLLRNSAYVRVAHFLFDMKKRYRRKEVDLLMTRQDIADHLNLTLETVSRAFTQLEKKSAISNLTSRRVAVNLRKRLAA
jgi:CRP/FNR family transcriptional regulator, nitrogen fixation regulation protein